MPFTIHQRCFAVAVLLAFWFATIAALTPAVSALLWNLLVSTDRKAVDLEVLGYSWFLSTTGLTGVLIGASLFCFHAAAAISEVAAEIEVDDNEVIDEGRLDDEQANAGTATVR